MVVNESSISSYKDYRVTEIRFHRELMNSCKKYINELSIISILGILEIVKQEAIELEQATRKEIEQEKKEENMQKI